MSGSPFSFYSAIESIGFEYALECAKQIAASNGDIWTIGSNTVFRASCVEQLAPSFRGRILTPEQAIEKWVRAYFGDYNNRPSVRRSNPPSTMHDTAA